MAAPIPTITQQLDLTAGLMQAGQFAQALQVLEPLVRANPGVARAHWLLGGALLNCGNLAGAERALRTALRIEPANASSLALLGEVLSGQGRLSEAEIVLRQALAIDPRHIPAAINLARWLLVQHRADEALQLIDRSIHNAQAMPALLLLRAHALLAMGDHSRAIPAFQRAIAAAPNSGPARIGIAVALADDGQHAAAEDAIRDAIRHGHTGAQSHYVLARALLGQQHLEEAESEFRTAIRLRADYIEAHVNLAETLWMRTADVSTVASQIDASLRAVPTLLPLRILKAKLMEAAGEPAAALAALDSALAQAGDSPALHIAAAQVAVKFDAARALVHAEHAWNAEPENPLMLGTYANALLATGHPRQAEALGTRLLAINPDDGLALALQATAWRMLGDPRYRERYDYGQFVHPAMIDTPDGWPNLPDYLDALARALLKLHASRAHPIAQSLRNGTQADLALQYAEDPAIRAFAQAIDGPIRGYMQAIGKGTDPLRRRNTGRYKLKGAWSVRLRPHGYHFNHVHPDGWLSSACYIQIPRALGNHGEGWLQFGEPAFPTTPATPPEYFVRPRPGLLVLFPSWFWHGTVPFSGGPEDYRLTIAFDVVPVQNG
jgi:tetratricopeptide (TPR) repeat protein